MFDEGVNIFPGVVLFLNGISISWFDFPIEFFFTATKSGSINVWLGLGDAWAEIQSTSTTRKANGFTQWGRFHLSMNPIFNSDYYS